MALRGPSSAVHEAPNAGDMCGLVHRPDSFVEGLASGGDLMRVAQAIVSVVDGSFETHPMRGGSKSMSPEWVSRRAFVVKTFRELQGDLKWTTDRALSALRPALLARLDGRPWRAGEKRTLYAPDAALAAQGAIIIDDPANAPAGNTDDPVSLDELKQRLKAELDLDADADD